MKAAWWSGNMLPSGQTLSLIQRGLLEEIPGSNPGAALFLFWLAQGLKLHCSPPCA